MKRLCTLSFCCAMTMFVAHMLPSGLFGQATGTVTVAYPAHGYVGPKGMLTYGCDAFGTNTSGSDVLIVADVQTARKVEVSPGVFAFQPVYDWAGEAKIVAPSTSATFSPRVTHNHVAGDYIVIGRISVYELTPWGMPAAEGEVIDTLINSFTLF